MEFQPGCTGKVGIDTEAHAREGARRKEGRAPYRCKHCGQWHTGRAMFGRDRDKLRMEPYHRAPPGKLVLVWEDAE